MCFKGVARHRVGSIVSARLPLLRVLMLENQHCEGEWRQYASHAPSTSWRVADMKMGARVMKCAIFVLCMLVTDHRIPIGNVMVRKNRKVLLMCQPTGFLKLPKALMVSECRSLPGERVGIVHVANVIVPEPTKLKVVIVGEHKVVVH